jgi:hypothetical protein
MRTIPLPAKSATELLPDSGTICLLSNLVTLRKRTTVLPLESHLVLQAANRLAAIREELPAAGCAFPARRIRFPCNV